LKNDIWAIRVKCYLSHAWSYMLLESCLIIHATWVMLDHTCYLKHTLVILDDTWNFSNARWYMILEPHFLIVEPYFLTLCVFF
jgi:hypothetical protein